MTNRLSKILMLGASPMMLAIAQPAFAQSTGSQEIEAVTVSANAQGSTDVLKPITVPKERATITQDFINTQPAGQTIFESLNMIPGVNFTNGDPYGNSGGNIRIHGFEGARISFTWDGMPLNDTGNYSIYTNQVADSEIINTVTVNQGTTDVDSPTASAVGGTINITTTRPKSDFAVLADTSFGSYDQVRTFGRVDSGAFGPWGTTAFASYSYDHYDKWKGPGYLQKRQYNAGIYQDMGDLGWIFMGMHFNQNRNNFYNSVTYLPVNSNVFFTPTANGATANSAAQLAALGYTGVTPVGVSAPNIALSPSGSYVGVGGPPLPTTAAGFGLTYDEAPQCARNTGANTPTFGTDQNESTSGTAITNPATGSNAGTTSQCTGYYNLRINPSDTGNVRIASLWHLMPGLVLTVDPSFQYVLANGGGVTMLAENDPRLRGTTGGLGMDLNGDGDLLDQVSVYSPSNTNTLRYGINTSLVWQITDQHAVQFAYTGDFGFHRQTGQMSFLDPNGNPYDVFGGYRDPAHRVLSADGTPIRSRDRRSHAFLNQAAFDYEGNFFDDALHVSAGVRAPFFQRDLNQLCYVGAAGSFNEYNPGANFQYCTSQTPTAVAANGTVQFAQLNATGFAPGALFTPPGQETVRYSRFLPNFGLSYTYGPSQFFASYAAGLSAPRTDSLYNGGNNGSCQTSTTPGCVYSTFAKVAPETTNSFTAGYRYTSDLLDGELVAYNTQFKNRIVTTYDAEQGISVDHNIGSVNMDGVDGTITVRPMDGLSIFNSVSYEHTRVSAGPLSTVNLNAAGTVTVSIAGKEVVETPNWTFDQRYQYKFDNFVLGIGGKFVGRRYATDANDYRLPSYVTVNMDATYNLVDLGWPESYIKFNAENLFNEKYFGSVQTTRTCFTPYTPTTSGCTSYPSLVVGFPATFEVTLRAAL
jgi:iron complex outermembrane receptor protein